jgi:hypothetical protein
VRPASKLVSVSFMKWFFVHPAQHREAPLKSRLFPYIMANK